MTAVTSRQEHLITSVRQTSFPGIGAEIKICAGDLMGSVLRSNNYKKEEIKVGRGRG